VLTHAVSPGEIQQQEDSGEESESKTKAAPESEQESEQQAMKLNQVLEQKLHKPQAQSLEILWKEIVAEIYGGFVPALTAKQRGQLGQFAKRCPPGTAAQVLEFALRDWGLFAAQVKSDAGLFKAPARPEV
jgi:hypothetical protein